MLKGEQVVYHKLPHRIKGPAVVVGNHATIFDWYLAWIAMRKSNITPVAARYFFSDSFKAYWLLHAGCIPKSVFAADSASAIGMMRCLKKGGILLLFPEAHTGAMSKSEPLPADTARFIRRLGLPVYGIHIDGATLCWPKWGKKHTGGLIEVSASKLFDGAEVKAMSPDVLQEKLSDFIAYDDFEFLKRHPSLRLKVENPAEHVSLAAWKCPSCGKQGGLSEKGDEVFCRCGFHAHVTPGYKMDAGFQTTQEWISWCVEDLRKEIEADPAWKTTSEVILKLPTHKRDGGQREAGKGVCTLSRDGLVYTGTMDGKETSLVFPHEEVFLLPFTAGRNFVIYRGEQCYIFCPVLKTDSARMSYASAILSGAI